ncbi:uncharacterized protein PV07_09333 [Cladophialophora immunda]|uniref:Zn(2)-C6 fungal-type domain-containing protein n=1 Tax=Cladophialophora immunda TaxID=569365 RepID=A0A0D2C6S8_9EURO|nr:uncharacterized protein PV07_09333 [Cladophialophora immunda]KIW26220.1 hypothetical protein PV07_09333 [Cladophialophora immunda]
MSDGPVRSETAVKRGQPKSRNGCITCKSKRRKCDETKPGCLRCRYYNITCGGYDQGIKWRPVKMSNLMRKRTQSNQPADAETEDTSQRTQTVHSSDNNDATAVDTDVSVQDTAVILQDLRSQRGSEPFAWDSSFISSSLDFGHIGVPPLGDGTSSHNDVFAGDVFDDLILDDFNQAQFDADALANLSFGHSPRSIDAGFLLPETPKASTPSKHGTYQVDALFLPFAASSTEYSGRGEQRSNDHDETLRSAVNVNGRESESLRQSTPVFDSQPQGNPPDLRPSAPNFRATASNASPQRHETPDDTPEAIETLFNVHTCRILSIQTDVSKSPWRTLIWPLSHGCPVLYHALAAMASFHISLHDSRFRSQACRHFQCSTQLLAASTDDNNMPLETAITTRLALGFAHAWDPQISSGGIEHIDAARALLRRAVSQSQTSQLSPGKSKILNVLAQTWVYIDVMARICCSGHTGSVDEELISSCSMLSPVPPEENVDSLLGCSSTLFPLLSRLADLVGRARRVNDKLNSLDNISRATDLKVAIERWTPPIDVEASEDKSRIVDMIQTAEAYRWAAILLLRQTVPEVPWAHSQLELAQKTLVYLATIPRDSPTTVVHAFPLMVAGVEAIQEENRDWIRRRWKQMSKAFNMVVAERCQKLIEEVWRRRDDFEERHGVRCVGGTQQASSSSNEPVPSQGDLGNPISGTDLKNRTEASLSLRSISPNFPDSLAFKKGIDPVTRAGYTEYTVRGRLHFLEIMKEWQWQVMLA